MMIRNLVQIIGGSALLACASMAPAKDVELFKADTGGEPDAPNVLFMFDNSANWKASNADPTKKEMEHQAFYEVISQPEWWVPDDKDPIVRVGIMTFAKGNNPKGGRVEEAVEGLDASYKDSLQCLLYTTNDCSIEQGKEGLPGTNNAPYALSMNEAYLYFAGKEPAAGTQDGTHDRAAVEDGTYASPQADNVCARDFAVWLGNGAPDKGEDNDAEDALSDLGGVLDSDPIALDPKQFESNWADEYARYLSGTDIYPPDEREQNLITYVVDVVAESSGPGGGKGGKGGGGKREAASALLKSIAEQGDGRYFKASNTDEIKTALNKILNEIQAVNDVFASTTLPVSVNVRGTNLNQVYMGVFRPDDEGKPRWQGNLKLYELAVDEETDEVFLADANGDRADSSVTGFIRSDAESYWTHDSDYWDFDPRGDPKSESDLSDGPVVEKGAAHQRLRDQHADNGSHTWRNLYTSTGTDSALESFDTSNSDVTSELSDTVIEWVRGRDTEDANNNDDDTDARPSMHGDVLHSEPAVVNYGDQDEDGDPDIYTFYGANDGIFHAVRGGKSSGETRSGGDGVGFGNELWGFIPEEFIGKLQTLYDNTATDFGDRPNFVDGAITVRKVDDDGIVKSADGDKVVVYLSMRRGGRVLYALDVTDPEDPELLWKRTHEDTGYAELGQTWSAPKVETIANDDPNNATRDVVIFGGGYDPADDSVPAGTHTQGRAIYVADAETGDLIWRASPNSGADVTVPDMTYAIPSRVTAVNRDFDAAGTADRLYVGDLGGQVWRVDINSGTPSQWQVHKLANIPGTGADGKRKFFFAPDVVFNDTYDAILLGSGDRTHPFAEDQDGVPNEFFMFKDSAQSAGIQSDVGDPIVHSELSDATDGSGVDASDSGWFFSLNTNELVVGRSVTLAGTVFFNTLDLVDSGALDCSANLGVARNYMVDFEDATATMENDDKEGLTNADRSTPVPGGGFAPAPTPVIVNLDGDKRQAVISGTQVHTAPGKELDQRRRSYWYRQSE